MMDDLRFLWVNLVFIGLSIVLMFFSLHDGLIWFGLMTALAVARWWRWRTWPRRMR